MVKELVKAPESLSVWMSNMKELGKKQPKLAQMLEYYASKHGHEFAHYETATPEGRWIEGLTPEPFFQPNAEPKFDWNRKSKNTPIFFQYGIGVPPYLFKSIRALPHEAMSMVVVEPSIALLAYVLHMTSVYAAMPSNASLVFMANPETVPHFDNKTDEEMSVINKRNAKLLREEALMAGINVYGVFTVVLAKSSYHANEVEALKDAFDDMYKEIREWTILRLTSLGNSAEDTMLGMRQMALMTPWISYGYQYTDLLNDFKGRPFIVVSAGPSLDKNLELLRDVRDKCVIVANDAVLNKMVHRGIIPHIVCTLERALPTYDLFYRDFIDDYYEECSNILLINQAVCAPQIFGRWPGPKMIVGKAELPVDRWFVVNTIGGQAVMSGASVAHMCHSIGVACGASSIALIGQDLAYSEEGQSHAADVGGSWKQDDAASIPGSFTADYMVPAAMGGEVATSEIWLSFLRTFEGMVQTAPMPTYDCTEGGALIAGSMVKPLKWYLEQHVEPLEPMAATPCEVALRFGVASDKVKMIRKASLKGQLEKASNDLDEAEGILREIVDLMKKVSAPALSPERRVPNAAKVGHLLDELHEKNPMFAFVTQSYTYLSTVELVRTRFLDTVDAVERWMALHTDLVNAHTAVLRFIRQWLEYADTAIDYYAKKGLPLIPPSPDEAMEKLEYISDKYGDGKDQVALRMEMDAFFASVDMPRFSWPGRITWQCANFLLKEGRSEEATVLMKAAAADFEDMEMGTDEIVEFLKDYARVLLTPDLCRIPELSLAETVLSNAVEVKGMDDELRGLIKATHEGEISLYIDYQSAMGANVSDVRKWFMARAVAADALANGDALKAMDVIWHAVCEYGRIVPGWAANHLDWLATNMEKFFGAIDEPYKTFIDDLLSDMASRQDVLAGLPIPYTKTFIDALVAHGMKVLSPQEEKTSETHT